MNELNKKTFVTLNMKKVFVMSNIFEIYEYIMNKKSI